MSKERIIFAATYDYDFSITKSEQTAEDSMSYSHYHNAYEIYYLVDGEKFCFVKDKYYKLKKGCLVFINRQDLHYMTASPNMGAVRFHILFKKEFIKELSDAFNVNLLECFEKDAHVLNLNEEQRRNVESIIFAMHNEFRRKPDGYLLYLKTALIQLLMIFSRNTIEGKILPECTEYVDEAHKIVSNASLYINNNFRENISLNMLADKFFISPSYFSKIFKKFSGTTFIDYLNSIRIKEAQILMTETKLSIAQISAKVGFGSPTHFGRIFKKHTSFSPLSYKKMNLR